MNYKFISDAHIHSDNSYDALDPTIKLCEHATKIGLYSITITDHCNCNEYNSKNSRRAIKQAFFHTKKAQFIFKDCLNVFTGIELGQPTCNKNAAMDALSQTNFDFVLAGIHKLKNSEEFSDLRFTNDNVNNIIDRYFEEIIDLIDWGNFDSLAHLTYPFKFISENPELKIDIDNISGKINIVMEKLANSNKAFEVDDYMNHEPASSILSSYHILDTFKKAGGQHLTFGSNSHTSKDIGSGINEGLNTAFEVGFTHFSLFKNRAPHLLPII